MCLRNPCEIGVEYMPEMRGGDRLSQIDATDSTDAANSQGGGAGCAIRVSPIVNVPANWYLFGLVPLWNIAPCVASFVYVALSMPHGHGGVVISNAHDSFPLSHAPSLNV
jgi:hypothetical protein